MLLFVVTLFPCCHTQNMSAVAFELQVWLECVVQELSAGLLLWLLHGYYTGRARNCGLKHKNAEKCIFSIIKVTIFKLRNNVSLFS